MCKWKSNAIYKWYKDDNITNGISWNDDHQCPYYNALDNEWHQNGNVMTHITTFTNDINENNEIEINP